MHVTFGYPSATERGKSTKMRFFSIRHPVACCQTKSPGIILLLLFVFNFIYKELSCNSMFQTIVVNYENH